MDEGGIAFRQFERDGAAPGVTQHRSVLDAEGDEGIMDKVCLLLRRPDDIPRPTAVPIAGTVKHDHAILLRGKRNETAGFKILHHAAVAMQQDQRLAVAAFDVVQSDAVDVDEPPLWRIAALGCFGQTMIYERGNRDRPDCCTEDRGNGDAASWFAPTRRCVVLGVICGCEEVHAGVPIIGMLWSTHGAFAAVQHYDLLNPRKFPLHSVVSGISPEVAGTCQRCTARNTLLLCKLRGAVLTRIRRHDRSNRMRYRSNSELAEADLDVGERAPLRGTRMPVWGLPVHFVSAGEGAPVILLHGNGSLGEEILSAFPVVPGVRWIAPDRPGYGYSQALPAGHEDPLTQAAWLGSFMDGLGVRCATIVAHSISAGLAVAFASAYPERVTRLALLAPFCRPTPHRAMPLLRLAVAPVVGTVIRNAIIPVAVKTFREEILQAVFAPGHVPPWLAGFPLSHAARPRAILTTAAELRQFNEGMATADRLIDLKGPVNILFGIRDQTAVPEWHLPWLRARSRRLRVTGVADAGHLVHHAAPEQALHIVLG